MTKYGVKHALLTSLALPLVFGGCVSQNEYNGVVTRNQQLEQQHAADQAHILRLQGAIKYTVNSDLLFPSGSWQMSADGQEVIAKMAKMLAADQEDKLLVNGYTDNAAIGPALRRNGVTTNQELSQKRAEAVRQYMISQGVRPNFVEARGFGDTQPVATNDTPQGRAQNRRVEITVAPPVPR